MKKAKLALTAVAVMAVVGGALASKAKGGYLTCNIPNSDTGNCNVYVLISNYCTMPSFYSTAFCDPVPHIGFCTNSVIFYPCP